MSEETKSSMDSKPAEAPASSKQASGETKKEGMSTGLKVFLGFVIGCCLLVIILAVLFFAGVSFFGNKIDESIQNGEFESALQEAFDEASTEYNYSNDDASDGVDDTDSTSFTEVITLSGSGSSNTDSFTLNGPRAKLVATVTGSEFGGFSSVTLESDAGDYISGGYLNITSEDASETTAETIIRDIEPGSYFLSVISTGDWEVTVSETE